jgi:ferrochelatase
MNVSKLPNEARATRPADHPPGSSGRVGVLIVNLGTPEGTDYWSIRRYLQEFLSTAASSRRRG